LKRIGKNTATNTFYEIITQGPIELTFLKGNKKPTHNEEIYLNKINIKYLLTMKKSNLLKSREVRSSIIKVFTAINLSVLMLYLGGCLNKTMTTKENDKQLIKTYVSDKDTPLWKYIESLPVIDTHEHFGNEDDYLGIQVDIFNLLVPYIVDNLESAGISLKEMALMKDGQASFKDRWSIFNKYYSSIQSTTYVLALQTSLEEQYRFKNFGLEECERVSKLLTKDFAVKGFMQKFMDKNKIESILTYLGPSMDAVRKSFGENNITLVPTVNNICVKDAKSLEEIAKMTETPIHNLDDILAGIDKLFKAYYDAGIKNIKFGSAYNREINYKPRTLAEAEASFKQIMATPFDYSDEVPGKHYVFHLSDYHIPLDDYLGIYMIKQAEKYNINAIFHVGIFAWNYNSAKNNHSSSLEWLIRNFPKVNFVILHSGYPLFDEAILLAKYYPNVYLNMTWDHIIERGKSIEVMKSYIEMLPTNKIHLFGGDYLFPQQIIGNMIFTKENLYIALSELIEKGVLIENQAKKIAYDWLYGNPKAFYY